jgi:hypothetical protein
MAVQSISTLMGQLKKSYDKSKDKAGWRVLQGMNGAYYDTFIAGNNNLWQIKSEEVAGSEFVAVGEKVSRSDDDLVKIMKAGSPVPFGSITPIRRQQSIIMAGMQTYSSDSSELLRREYLSGKQAALEQKLKSQVDKMMDDPAFRKKYSEHKDRVRRAYL